MKGIRRGCKKYIILLCMGLLAAGVIIFCLAVGSMGDKAPVNIIYITKVMDGKSDFWTQLFEGMNMAAKEFGVSLQIAGPEREDDYKRQNELIAWAIEQKPQVIILSPGSVTETVEAAAAIGEHRIKLVFIDSSLEQDMALSVVGTDNVMAGAEQGKYIKGLLQENSQIAVIGHVKGSSTAIQREEGLRMGLGEDADKIVEVVFCDSDYQKAYLLMKELIRKYPDITVAAGLNEYSAVGAARAIKEMGLSDRIKVVGFDNSLEEVKLLEEGILQATIIQKPFKMGYLAVEAAMKAIEGEPVSASIDSGYKVITKENMYTEENQKLLFPFKEE